MSMHNRMITSVRGKIEKSFGDEIRFFKGWVKSPKNVGSIIPTSDVMAKRMASLVNVHSGLPVLELGPGTGVITRAILQRGIAPDKVTCIEFSPEFAKKLRHDFTGVNIIEGNAFDLDATLGAIDLGAKDSGNIEPNTTGHLIFDCVVSALPLLSFPRTQRVKLIKDLLERIPDGRPVVQFSYGPLSPVPPIAGVTVRHLEFIFRNVPPAQIWTYRKTSSAGKAKDV
jgi:phosphatidylethanolamine/phosphatidyl-N-methylethanolamine N-methyltransferase